MRKIIPVALATWASSAWARYEDLWGDEDHPGGFSTELQAAIFAAVLAAAWWFYLYDKGSRLRWVALACVLLVPVWYAFKPGVLALYVFAPLLWFLVLRPLWAKFSQG